jgi:hypothetical protein
MLKQDNKEYSSIGEVLTQVPMLNNQIDIIDLSNNKITWGEIYKLPEHIIHVNLYNNTIKDMEWGQREWGVINIGNNGLSFNQITNLKCTKLDLTDNLIEELTLICCDIKELIISNNSLKEINFIECSINKLNLSFNGLTKITHLPIGISEINFTSNKIDEICELVDTLLIVDLHDNYLKNIPNIPKNLIKLDLSENKFKNFKIKEIPDSLEYFDISDNFITKTDKLFESIKKKMETFYYDSDNNSDVNESNDTNNDNININFTSSNENFDDSMDSSDSEDSEISLNIIPRRTKNISFDSINFNEIVDTNDNDTESESDDEIDFYVDKIINESKKKHLNENSNIEYISTGSNNNNYKEISWIPKISTETSSDEEEKVEKVENQVNVEPINKVSQEQKQREMKIKAYQEALLRSRSQKLEFESVNGNGNVKGNSSEQIQVELTEDQKIIKEIMESRSKVKKVYGDKIPIQLKWEIEL